MKFWMKIIQMLMIMFLISKRQYIGYLKLSELHNRFIMILWELLSMPIFRVPDWLSILAFSKTSWGKVAAN